MDMICVPGGGDSPKLPKTVLAGPHRTAPDSTKFCVNPADTETRTEADDIHRSSVSNGIHAICNICGSLFSVSFGLLRGCS